MEKISIEEVAYELGMQSRDLIKRVQLLYKEIKSPKSKVPLEVAQEIFEIIMFNKESKYPIKHATAHCGNINLYFTSEKIDISFVEQIAKIYKEPNQNEFMIRSFNFDEHAIVNLLTAGLINLDIKKYLELKSTDKELTNLLKNINKIIDDVDFENIDDKNPLDEFEKYIQIHQPEEVYIEGVTYTNFLEYRDVFTLIKKLSKNGINFEIGFVEMEIDSVEELKKTICS